MKTVENIFTPKPAHFVGDGFRVHNFIPSYAPMTRMSPFIMLDYNSTYNFPPSEIPKGVGVHPHRGFETVTIAYKGKVEHGDSSGGVIGEGDVQWMTAASGVLHKEFHETEWSKQGGDFQMVQLWVNLPAKDKMSAPKYQALEHATIPKVELDDNAGVIEVIAGEYNDVKGGASTFTAVNLMNAKLKKDASVTFDFPAHYNTALLIIEGNVTVNDTFKATTNKMVLFYNDGDKFTVKADDDAIVLVMSGEPIDEPIASYGPFVMNTMEEIQQAFEDFNTGKFGELE